MLAVTQISGGVWENAVETSFPVQTTSALRSADAIFHRRIMHMNEGAHLVQKAIRLFHVTTALAASTNNWSPRGQESAGHRGLLQLLAGPQLMWCLCVYVIGPCSALQTDHGGKNGNH